MIAPTFGCYPLSGNPVVVTASAPPTKMAHARNAATRIFDICLSPFRVRRAGY